MRNWAQRSWLKTAKEKQHGHPEHTGQDVPLNLGLAASKPFYPNALPVEASAALHSPGLQDSQDSQLHDSLYYKRGAQHRHNNRVSPWGSEIARKKQMVIFWMPRPIPARPAPAVPWVITPSAMQIPLGFWASMPSLFAISQLTACLSRAPHSFSLPLLWPFKGFVTLRAKSPSPRVSETGSPLHCIVHVPVSPSAFSKKKRTSWYNSKSSTLGGWAVSPLRLLIGSALFPP